MVDSPAADRGYPQHELRVGRQLFDPPGHHVPQQRRKVPIVIGADRAGQLLQEERVALGALVQRLGQRGVGLVAEHGGE